MNTERLTKCICHKGFSVDSSIVARSNFRVGGQETAPQSLTAHTLDRYQQGVEKQRTTNLPKENEFEKEIRNKRND